MSDVPESVPLFDLYQLVPAAEETDLAYEALSVRDQREMDRLERDVWLAYDGDFELEAEYEPPVPPETESGLPAERWSPGQAQGLLEHMLGAQVVDDDPGPKAG